MIKILNRLKSEIGQLHDVINMSYKKPFNALMTAELTIKSDNPAIIHLQPFNFIEVTDDFGEYIGVFRLMMSAPSKEGDSATIKYTLYQAGHTLIDTAVKKSKVYTGVSAYDIVSELLALQSHKYWVVDGSLRSIPISSYELEVQNGLLTTIFDIVNNYSEKMVVFDTSNVWTIKVKDIPTINCRIKEGYNLTNFDIEENYLSIINRIYAYAEWSEYENEVEVLRRVTMASANNNKEYVENTDLVNKYGVIEKVELIGEECTPQELLEIANKTLRQHTQRVKSIRVSAVDMVKASTNDLSIDLLRVGNRVFFDSDDFGTSELVIMSESKGGIFGKPESIDLEISMDRDSTSITSTIRDLKSNIKGVTTIAERAIMSANGKNKVYYNPENQAPLQPQNGDIWFRDNADGTTSYLVRIADTWVDKSPSINTEALETAINNNKKIIEAAQAAANAAVKPGEIFTQINQQAGNVLIRAEQGGAKLNITKDNVFMDAAVIKQANIDLATINDAFLKNVTFDWARGKTIDANEINVVNLSGRNLTFDTIFVNRFNASGIGADIDLSSNQSINRTVSNQVVGKLSDPTVIAQFKGEKGEKGDRGLTGATGAKGDKGVTGDRGLTGPKGADGQSSYLHTMYHGTSKPLNTDPHMEQRSMIHIYNNAKDDSVVHNWEYQAGSTQSYGKHRVKISHVKAGGAPARGGWYFPIRFEKPRQVFVVEFEAHAPAGSIISVHSNSLGPNGYLQWLTDNTGEGRFKVYRYALRVGDSGYYEGAGYGAGYIAITHTPDTFSWFVSYVQAWDITDEMSEFAFPGATHMGTYTSNTSARSELVYNYKWTKIQGDTGKDAAVYSPEPPEDTSRIWFDSDNKVPKYYNHQLNKWVTMSEEAYEDLEDKITNLETKVTELPGKITKETSAKFISVAKGNTILESIASVTQTASDIKTEFKSYVDINDPLVNKLSDSVKQFSTIINESTEGINISKSGSVFNINIDNDSLDIRNGDKVVAYASESQFYGNKIEILEELIFDDIRFVKRKSGNKSLIKFSR